MTHPTTDRRTPPSPAWEHPPAAPTPGPAPAPARKDRVGAGWLVLLLPVACCAGPLLIAGLAAGGAATGTLVIAVPASIVALALMVRSMRRHRSGDTACCPPSQPAPRR